MKKLLFAGLIASALISAQASITLPRIFSNNMVMQAQEPAKIWGKAEANAAVEIKIDSQSFATKANSDGAWSIVIAPQKAEQRPKEIRFFENSKESKVLKNVLFGEVWISGGQSNMEFKLRDSIGGKEACHSGDFPNIRFFRQGSVPKSSVQSDSPSGAAWYVCNPKNSWAFSAVSFYFARDLYENLNVPIGIVETAFSGSYMIAWLARQDLKGISAFEKPLEKFERDNANYDYQKESQAYKEKLEIYKKAIEGLSRQEVEKIKKPTPPPIALGTKTAALPSMFYNSKIAPIAGFCARGFIWYQGESDAIANPEAFAEKFERLINSWRKYWGKSDMPFYFVQLPSIDRKAWVDCRAAQDKVAKKLKNVEMAVALDTGDIKDVHPKEKLSVGKRLARLALINIYGRKNLANFPRLAGVRFNGNSAEISIECKNSKLKIREPLRGFEVLVGGTWIEPKAALSGGKINLKSEGEIEAVRYLWKNWALPDVCIFNSEDMPLAPFLKNKN